MIHLYHLITEKTVKYVGLTKDARLRSKAHTKKYPSHKFKVVKTFDNEKDARQAEIEHIKKYNTYDPNNPGKDGWNKTPGGDYSFSRTSKIFQTPRLPVVGNKTKLLSTRKKPRITIYPPKKITTSSGITKTYIGDSESTPQNYTCMWKSDPLKIHYQTPIYDVGCPLSVINIKHYYRDIHRCDKATYNQARRLSDYDYKRNYRSSISDTKIDYVYKKFAVGPIRYPRYNYFVDYEGPEWQTPDSTWRPISKDWPWQKSQKYGSFTPERHKELIEKWPEFKRRSDRAKAIHEKRKKLAEAAKLKAEQMAAEARNPIIEISELELQRAVVKSGSLKGKYMKILLEGSLVKQVGLIPIYYISKDKSVIIIKPKMPNKDIQRINTP